MPHLASTLSRHLLVTGASGYVGLHLSAHLARAGFPIAGTFLSNPVSVKSVDAVPVDLSELSAVRRLLRDMRPAAIVHCAAATDTAWCEQNPAEAEAAILRATENLCAARAQYVPESPLIGFSTDLVFDGTASPYRETDCAKPLNVYGGLKLRAETVVLANGGTVLRSALVYGPPAGGRNSFLRWMKDRLSKREPLNLFSDEFRTPVFVLDLCRAVELLLAPHDSGVFHAGGPDSLSRVDIGRNFGEVFGLPTESIVPVPRSSIQGGHLRAANVSLDSSKLIRLGWKQTPLKDGLIQCRNLWQ